ncbi:MAG: hydrogenase 4 subunit D, partial [Yersinia sp. (in: enterobacteria)]
MNIALMNIALATILVPFAGAILTACLPQQWAKWSCTFFSLLATLGTVLLAYIYLSGGKIDVTVDLIHYGDMALFGLTIDRISTLIAFAVVFLGLLVSIYSTGYLTLGNREHPHEGTNRYYALLLVFIGAMAGLVL